MALRSGGVVAQSLSDGGAHDVVGQCVRSAVVALERRKLRRSSEAKGHLSPTEDGVRLRSAVRAARELLREETRRTEELSRSVRGDGAPTEIRGELLRCRDELDALTL